MVGPNLDFHGVELSEKQNNALLLKLEAPIDTTDPCASADAPIASTTSTPYCPGEGTIINNDSGNQVILQKLYGGTWYDLDTFEVSIEVHPMEEITYRLVDANCPSLISNEITIVPAESNAKLPAGITCGLNFWIRADSSINYTINEPLETGTQVSHWETFNATYTGKSRDESNLATDEVIPIWVNNGLNFNPGVYFDGSDNIVIGELTPIGNLPTTIYTVVSPADNAEGTSVLYDFGRYSEEGFGLGLSNSEAHGYLPNEFYNSQTYSTIDGTSGNVAVQNLYHDSGSIVVNGDTIVLFNNGISDDQILYSEEMDLDDSNGGPFTIGMRSSSFNTTSSFKGMIHEVIAFNKALSEEEDIRLRSYLSMKYGLGMMNLSPWNLVSSEGEVIYEATGAYVDYLSGISAIGLDDGNHHYQRKSKGADDLIVVGMLEGWEASHGDFLAWGNNGANVNFDRTVAGLTNTATNRVWRFQETGETGTVRLVVGNADELGITHVALHPHDPQVTNPETVLCLQELNGRKSIDLNIGDGYYMTLLSLPIDLNENITSPSCETENGQIQVDVVNAWVSSTFSWIPSTVDGASTGTINNLGEGTYQISVEDASGCRIVESYELINEGGITLINETVTRVSCNGAEDAIAQVTLQSSKPPIVINWDHGATGNQLTGLSGGTYSYTAIDDAGCEYSGSVLILEPEELTLEDLTVVDNACQGNSEGVFSSTINGGSPPYDVKLYLTVMDMGLPIQSLDFASLEGVTGDFTFSDLTSSTYQLEVTDNAGCSLTYDFEIQTTVALPLPICPANQTEVANDNCEFVIPDYFFGITPNNGCSIVYQQNPAPGTVVSVGNVEVTLTIGNGITSNACSFNLNVQDQTSPQITAVFEDQTVSSGNSCQATVPDFVSGISVTDNCSTDITISQNPSPGTVISSPVLVTILASDESLNESTVDFLLTPIDDTPPSLNCPNSWIVEATGVCQGVVPLFATAMWGATDNCGISQINQSISAGTLVNSGTFVDVTVTDNSGNEATCSIELIVEDNTNPTINCQDQSVALSNSCDYTIPDYSGVLSISDNCGVQSVVQNPVAGSTVNAGLHTIELTAFDYAGNSYSCSFDLSIIDDTIPQIVCPSDWNISLPVDGCLFTSPNWVDEISPITTACSALSVTSSIAIGEELAVGIHDITFTATSGNGNSNACTTEITVSDISNPILDCPSSININANPSCEVSVPDLFNEGMVSIVDNCSFDFTQSIPAGSSLNENTNITITATDGSLNQGSCTVELIPVVPNPLAIGCPISLPQQSLDSNCEFQIPDYTPLLSVTTPCSVGFNVIQSPAPGSLITSTGDHLISFEVQDDLGNEIGCSVELSVRDFNAPVQTTSSTQVVQLAEGDCEFILESWDQIISFSDCTPISFWSSTSLGDSFEAGFHTITGQVLDDFGQPANFNISLEVVDNTAPIILCQNDVVEIEVGDDCTWVWPNWEDYFSFTDPCGANTNIGVPVENSPGEYTVEVEAYDLYHSVTCQINAIIVDNNPPVISNSPADQDIEITLNCAAQIPDYTTGLLVGDNCTIYANLQFTQTPETGTWIDEITTVVITVQDEAGKESSCNFEVTPVDSTAPSIINCANDVELNFSNCHAVMPSLSAALSVTDNCVWEITQSIPSGSSLDAGTYQVDFQVIDSSNNVSTCSSEVHVSDVQSPEIDVIALTNYYTQVTCFYEVGDITSYVNVSDCSNYNLTMTPGTGELLEEGIHDFIVNVTDEWGNPATAEFSINVVNSSVLAIDNCPEDQDAELNQDCVYVMPDFTSEIVVMGTCGDEVNWTQTPPAGTVINQAEAVTVSIEAAHESQTENCSFILNILDNQNPVLACQDLEIALDACSALMPNLEELGWATDCSNLTYGQSIVAGEILTAGNHTVTFTVTDQWYNSTQCEINILVVDTTAPIADCSVISSAPIEITCDFTVSDWTEEILITDNCLEQVVITQTSIGEAWQAGIHEVEFLISDGVHEITCNTEIELINVDFPIVTCPENIEAELQDNNTCELVIDYELPQIQNGCGSFELMLEEGLDSGESYPLGTTSVTYSIEGMEYEEASCSFDITVIDPIDPVIECQDPIVTCNPVVVFDLPEYSDNCVGVTLEQIDLSGLQPGDTFPYGETLLQYKAIDASGNWVMCTQSVTVIEPEAIEWSSIDPVLCIDDAAIDLNSLIQTNTTTTWSDNVPNGILLPQDLGAGSHDITLSSLDVCYEDSTQTIVIAELPSANWLTPLESCGLVNNLEIESDASLLWNLPEGAFTDDDLQSNTIEVQVEESGNYLFEIHLISEEGCESSSVQTLFFENDYFTLDAGPDATWVLQSGTLNGTYSDEGETVWTSENLAFISDPLDLQTSVN
ncbi:MAG: HYR domain-containing protein, partial [Flavobacteriales bacterium]|nr:HYR domain-containing protein [Flavobacteriales bacterium]